MVFDWLVPMLASIQKQALKNQAERAYLKVFLERITEETTGPISMIQNPFEKKLELCNNSGQISY